MSVEAVDILSEQHETFAVQIASGNSYRKAAASAGFHPDYGFRLMQIPAIQARIAELVRQPEERIRAGIEIELLQLRNRVADEEELTQDQRATVELRLKLLLAHAKFRGWIVDKKQTTKATIDVSKMLNGAHGAPERAQLIETLGAMLTQLQPAQRRRIEAIAAGKGDAEPEQQ